MRNTINEEIPSEDRSGTDLAEDLAKLVSRITYPTFFCIPAFVAIDLLLLSWPSWLYITSLCLIFATLIPIIVILAWTRSRRQSGLDLPRREDRNIPLIMVVISYLVGTIVLALANAPLIITCLMLCYFSNTAFVLLVNLRWKISIHSMGAAGPTVALLFTFGYLGLIPALLIPLVMWSRVRLKHHTIAQVIAGASLGIALTAVQFVLIV